MNVTKQYKKATLYAPKGETTWLIVWSNINPATGQLERLRKTFNLNRIDDIKERRATGIHICATINQALQNGWNYFTPDASPPNTSKFASDGTVRHQPVTLLAAFKKAYIVKTMKNKDSSLRTYKSVSGIFQSWILENKLGDIPATAFTANHFLEYIIERYQTGVGSRNLNMHISLVKAVFMKMWRPLAIIKENPLSGYEMFDEADSNYFEPLTNEELERVANQLRTHDPNFFLYTQVIYYGFIRPSHITYLRRRQFDFKNDLIHIEGDNTKNNRNSSKQLLLPLKHQFLAAGIDKLAPDDFIFSTDFKPAPTPFRSLYPRASEKWSLHVREALGIDKFMYALKHTAATAYIDDNDEPNAFWLQRQMEHSSLAETEAYIRKRKVKKIDAEKINFGRY